MGGEVRRMAVSPSKSLVLVCAAGGVLAALAAPGQAASAPRGWAKPVLVSKTLAHRETSLVLDPTNVRNQMICDPSGVPSVDHGQSYFHRSSDGGRTWHEQNVEGATDLRQATFEGGDCDVAIDRAGTMYSADTWLGDLSVGHSTDHGKTWDGTPLSGTSPIIDRPWLVGGAPGTVYLSYHDLQCCSPAAMWFTKSTDYGKTFSPAVPITTANTDGAFIWEGNFVVAPNGKDIYLVYSRRSSINGISAGVDTESPMSLWLASSHDAGTTWTSSRITNLPVETSTIYPAIGLDKGGYLHVVWSMKSSKGNPVFYTYSANAGRTWRSAVPLNPGHVGWAPWIVGGHHRGEAAVAWLGSPDPAATQSTVSPWYFDWARVTVGASGKPAIRTGSTTKSPLWEGKQTEPEFEMVALDAKGLMHLGMSIYQGRPNGGAWSVWNQTETSTSH
ncbi:MAG: hypothetical protein QOK42_314 [Frankiaceae bacterium]|nr:hypothetical protein [Frankiaceae bacterium]